MAASVPQQGSSSLRQPNYWWYRARADLLETVLSPYLGQPTRMLDVGSADGPSVEWMDGAGHHVALDLFPEGLRPGSGVQGSAMALPFRDEVFDVVEHCEDDRLAVAELNRVLRPGGRMLLSVPAYDWAWSDHDVRAGHHRRYTRPRLVRLVEQAGLTVERSTYAFGSVFPFFLAERTVRRLRQRAGRPSQQSLTAVPGALDTVLTGLSRVDRRMLRRWDLPFGSSVFLAATKPRA